MDLLIFALTIGIVYSLLALSIVFSFRILGFPDLTPDGTLLVGASVGAIIINQTNSVVLALISSFVVGAFFGIITALLHNKLKISKLLSGILVMTMLYSVSLRVMGTSNISLINSKTIWFADFSKNSQLYNLFIAIIVVSIVFSLLYLLLKTNIGLRLRALGDSENTAKNLNLNIGKLNVIGLAISNGLAGLAGIIIAQYQGFVDVSMGTGLVIIGLASIIIGEIILKPKNIFYLLLAGIVGMIIYQSVISIALRFGLPSTDLKIATVMLTILFIFIERIRKTKATIDRQIGNRNI